ncbi:MmgE/PrpD family protein [Verticiella sediminum]|uniref:MmgE/PrpD family protein n=1 Tax=Verticiella sediminum TaxID=1247510 RepID=A0A556AJM1_9BURK|nr:MmgE/PrpD family protein [Verticiella sediminum]TSH93060.1 MmgE/PrpD family protein [Verticiella sediminum]
MNVEGKSSALALLAAQARRITLDELPADVRRQGALCILDTIGCMIAGTATPEARMLYGCESEHQGGPAAVVPGTDWSLGLYAALRANGYLGDILELNDLIGGHASIGNVTAALALAEVQGASGAALLEAAIRGVEITTRVYAAVYPSLKRFTEVGMVPVGIPSSVGAAAAAARLLDLDEGQTRHAMAIAGAMAGWCPAEVIFGDGGTMKPLLFGAQPAAVAVKAAFDARNGMTGPQHLLDSKLGYFNTVSVGGSLDDAPARAWALAAPRRKLHACCGYIHAPVDAVAQLRPQLARGFAGGTLQVHVAPYVADVVSKAAPPNSPNDARFHLQYCLAIVMQGGDTIRPEHSIRMGEHLADPAIVQAMGRVTVVADPTLNHYHQCKAVFTAADGRQYIQAPAGPRGSAQCPLSDDEVVAKFVSLAEPVLGRARAEQVVQVLTRLEDLANVRELARLLVPSA